MAKYQLLGKYFDGERLWDPNLEEDEFIELPDDVEPPSVAKALDKAGERAVKKRDDLEAMKAELNRNSLRGAEALLNDLVVDVPEPKKRKTPAEVVADAGDVTT